MGKVYLVPAGSYDSFYCPHCQPATRAQAIPWGERTKHEA
jgi:hypothetical protein